MTQSQLSLSWDEYNKNICNGLSALQQNGEFVDMTLAADGHLVKVHQIVMALASPYIKELIASAKCQHPVIFLNKISYTTLCALLEYVYTGEVLVSVEDLSTLLEAGKELHIKGLEDMNVDNSPLSESCKSRRNSKSNEACYIEIVHPDSKDYIVQTPSELDEQNPDETLDEALLAEDFSITEPKDEDDPPPVKTQAQNVGVMQYTVSNQGNLQMILNRYIYYLKHKNRNNTRQWRCVDYISHIKCPAHVITKNDVVLKRIFAHTHTFHDKKILKKVRAGAIFTAITEAEREGDNKRKRPVKYAVKKEHMDSE